MVGELRVVQILYTDIGKLAEVPPVYHLELHHDQMTFSIEIALNAKIDTTNERMVAVKSHILGNYVGFYLQDNEDTQIFKEFMV